MGKGNTWRSLMIMSSPTCLRVHLQLYMHIYRHNYLLIDMAYRDFVTWGKQTLQSGFIDFCILFHQKINFTHKLYTIFIWNEKLVNYFIFIWNEKLTLLFTAISLSNAATRGWSKLLFVKANFFKHLQFLIPRPRFKQSSTENLRTCFLSLQ